MTVEALDEAGRGIVHIDGKPVLVEGALVGERVSCRPRRGRRQAHLADLGSKVQALFTASESGTN